MKVRWLHLPSLRHLTVGALICALITVVLHFMFVRPSPQPLIEAIGLTPVTNGASPREIRLRNAGCEASLAAEMPMLVLADLDVRATDTFEGYFEISENEEGLFVDYDPGESGLLRLGVAVSDGQVVRERLRTMRGASVEPVAMYVANSTVTWWSRERSAQITNVAPLGCASLHVGTANGVATIPGGTRLAVLLGNDATNALPIVEKYFRSVATEPPFRRLTSLTQLALIVFVVLIVIRRTRQFREPRR